MVGTRTLRFLLILGLVALLIPVSLAQAREGSGTAVIRDASGMSDSITITMSGVDAPAQDTAYEGWLISDDGSRMVSVGMIEVQDDGSIDHAFSIMDDGDPTGENLFADFRTFAITVEPVPDEDAAASAEQAYIGRLPTALAAQVRILAYSAEGNAAYASGPHTGMGKGMAVGLREQAAAALDSARQAQVAARDGDLEAVQAHAACVVGIIQGSESCGDGTGVTAYAAGVIAAANQAMQDAGPNSSFRNAANAAVASARIVSERASRAASQAMLAVSSTDVLPAGLYINNAEHLLGENTEGIQGAAQDAYIGAQDMGAYTLTPFPGVGEPIIPQLARYALISGVVLALLGLIVVASSRRFRTNPA